MDCAALATYGEQARNIEKIDVVDSTAFAQQKVRAAAWLGGAALAFAMLAAMAPWSGALADDPIADALSLVEQERYPEASEILEPMLRQEPDSPDVRLIHGVLQARQGNLAEAVAIFEGLRNDNPAMFEAHNNLAVLYARAGRLDDAREALVAALELRSDAVVYANLGDVYMKLAERAYQQAHALRDQGLPAREGGGQASDGAEPAQTTDEPPAPAAPADAEPDLAADVREPEDSRSPAESEATPEPAPVAVCVRVGWFEESATADEAVAWMRAAGAEAVGIRYEERQVIRNYQVYLPPVSSREAARAVAGALRDKGVDDIWIIAEGAQANGISLGVYRSKGNMTRRVAELEKLGYSVAITANTKTVTEYAVEARTGDDVSALEDAWNAGFPDHAIRRMDCADLA